MQTMPSACLHPDIPFGGIVWAPNKKKAAFLRQLLFLLRRGGSNSRPSGYEPDELPLLYFAMWAAKVTHMRVATKENLSFIFH
jgi:hypothetical protein